MTRFRIGNIMLGTVDLERALAFYGTTLGLPVQFQSTEMAFLDAGAITLCLSTPHARLRTPVSGATEVVFVVEGVREAHADLSARGVVFLNEPQNVTGDQWAANFRDPDGHLLSIFGPEQAPSVVP